MELHTAIRNILKYQGNAFLLDPKMINALIDFQAYENHTALKNIFRVLHYDGYVSKIAQRKNWDETCDQLVYEAERDYAFPKDLVEYVLKSVAYGIEVLDFISVPSSNAKQQKKQQRSTHNNKPSKSWKSLSIEDKESLIKKLIKIDSSFSSIGLHIAIVR